MPHSVGLARELGERGCFLRGDRHGLELLALELQELQVELLVVPFPHLILQVEDELARGAIDKQLVVLARERAYGLGTGGSALGRGDGFAVELEDSHEVRARPQFAFKLAELGDGFGCGGHRQLQSGNRSMPGIRLSLHSGCRSEPQPSSSHRMIAEVANV